LLNLSIIKNSRTHPAPAACDSKPKPSPSVALLFQLLGRSKYRVIYTASDEKTLFILLLVVMLDEEEGK
jgi:hypothetical protein